uniref:Uncharacterized protein n=1 Tax=Arundo donax TaxID=35708 RepID=A0A0A9CH97_ARUDO
MLHTVDRIKGLIDRPKCIRLRNSSSCTKASSFGCLCIDDADNSIAELINPRAKSGTSSSKSIGFILGFTSMSSAMFKREHKNCNISTMQGTPNDSLMALSCTTPDPTPTSSPELFKHT